jgi:murein DD-endopeptidase MepM/ murein hydrolase activator NlpD
LKKQPKKLTNKSQASKQSVAIFFDFIETIIENRLFKPVIVSIITSFVLFNGFSYLKTYLDNRKLSSDKILDRQIKINIPDNYYGFNLNENQVLQHQIKVGDTLLKILLDLGAGELDVFNILSEMRKVYDPRLIKVGDRFTIKYQVQLKYPDNNSQDQPRDDSKDKSKAKSSRQVVIQNITFNPSAETEIGIAGTKNADGTYSYQAKRTNKVLTKQIVKYFVTVKNGLYVDGTDVGISPNIMLNMINLYSFDVDFQRDIREGDKFEVLFESFYDDKGNRIKDGNVLFASLDLQQKRTIGMYLNTADKRNEYFDAKGNSVRKSLLRTPINGARISSGFGVRRHPILGYTKIHKGIDFAAPSGTPILAAGAGTITYYNKKGGYGNFVQIRHNSDYSTAYAHASRFVKRLRVGSKVKQGDVVAYVGTTGRSTGPHLHYEIIFRGKQVNPSKVKSTSGLRLAGKELKKFLAAKEEIDRYLKNTPNQNKL